MGIPQDQALTVLCPVCDSSRTKYWFTKDTYPLYHCLECRLIFIWPLPTDTSGVYGQDYFCGAGAGRGYVDYDADKQADVYTFNAYIDRIESLAPNKGRLLDVGAATGAFIAAAKARGWEVTGLEISNFAADVGKKKGLDIQTGTIESARFENASFDAVTLWDVLEHVRFPKHDLALVSKILKPGGVLAINTPDSGALFARLSGKWWPLLLPPEHIHLFSRMGLVELLKKNNFEVLSTARIGKKFKPAYILHMLSTVRNQKIWKRLSVFIEKTPLNRLQIPLNLRDNVFVVARKK